MPILLVKKKMISSNKKKELRDGGYIVIEVEDPKADAVFLDEMPNFSRDVILESTLEALSYGNDATCRNKFGDIFRSKILKKIQDDKTKKP